MTALAALFRPLLARLGREESRDVPPLDGPLRPNAQLERAWTVADRLDGPDDVAADDRGALFVSTRDAVLRIVPNLPRAQRFAALPAPGGALALLADRGMFVALAGHGIARVDAEGRIAESITGGGDRPLRCVTALALAGDGSLFIAEGSTQHGVDAWQRDLLEGGCSGRLLCWRSGERQAQVLVDGLAWPQGLVLSDEGRALVASEAWRHRLLRFDLAALERGRAQPEVVLADLPAYPGRLARAVSSAGGEGPTYWLACFAPRNRLVEFVLREPAFRSAMLREVPQKHWIAPSLHSSAVDPYPWLSPHYTAAEDYLETLQTGRLRSFGAMKPWAPARSYGLVVKLDAAFEPVASMHSRVNDMRHGITGVAVQGAALLAVSRGYGMLMRTSTEVALERTTEQIKKKKLVREELKKYRKGATEFVVPETPFLRVAGASKRYGAALALDGVDFDLRAGEVHALLGENGAGKSTLCKALAGAIPLTEGRILIDGVERGSFSSAADALAAGIAMVYQETSLVPWMTVAQNIQLGHERPFQRLRPFQIHVQQFLASLGFAGIDAKAYVAGLGAAHRQMVEIARAVYHEARVIIFDEPTASLTPAETRAFFELVESLRARGVAMVFISHALEEALQISDRITILRDGRHVTTGPARAFSRDEVVRLMVGRAIEGSHFQLLGRVEKRATRKKKRVLSVENLNLTPTVRNMSFSVYEGEITGIAGLVGAGRTEAAKVIAGVLKRDLVRGGTVRLDGRPVRYRVPAQAIRDGIVYVTEDRKLNGFFETLDIAGNIHLGALASPDGRRWLVSADERRRAGAEWTERLAIRALDPRTRVNRLSGGNQQKVVVAKSMVQQPRIVIFDEPTRGVDIGAIQDMHAYIRSLAREGIAVIVISSYLPEVMTLADRILVARQGQIVADFAAADTTEDKIMAAAMH